MSDVVNEVEEAAKATAREVRKWAREAGHAVGVRGRVSAELKKLFTEATGRQVK